MTRVIALLRAVNVGGTGKRPDGRTHEGAYQARLHRCEDAAAKRQRRLRVQEKSDAKLEATLEAVVLKTFGVTTDFYVRTAAEWDTLIAKNPFPDFAKDDPGRFVVMTFKDAPAAANVKALRAAILGRETIEAVGKQLYMYYPDGQGESKLTAVLIAKHLGMKGTARNWNTVLKLQAAAAALVSPRGD